MADDEAFIKGSWPLASDPTRPSLDDTDECRLLITKDGYFVDGRAVSREEFERERLKDPMAKTMLGEIKAFREAWPDSDFGPAHIVISDENLAPGHLQWCLGFVFAVQQARKAGISAYDPESENTFYQMHSDAELEATRLLLTELLYGIAEVQIEIGTSGTWADSSITQRRWRDVTTDGGDR